MTTNSNEKTTNGHGLEHICYADLDKKQREAYHYQKVTAIIADYGFICTWQHADWHGADFIAVGVNGEVLKVQLKSGGFGIYKKYLDYEDLWMLFPNCGDWYLIKHKELVDKVGETTKRLGSNGWKKENGSCTISSAKIRIPRKLEASLKEYKFVVPTSQE